MSEKENISPSALQRFWLLCFAEGLMVLYFNFRTPSEAKVSALGGYSWLRIALGALTLMCALLFLLAALTAKRPGGVRFSERLNRWLTTGDRLYFMLCLLGGLLLILLWVHLFTWLLFPANLRPQVIWALLISAQAWLLLRFSFTGRIQAANFREKYRLLPRWGALSRRQKQVFGMLTLLSLLYVLLLMPANLNGSQSMEAFSRYGGDEVVIYPILMDVMAPGDTLNATLYHRFIYEDYHYGYPFYAWSALVLLPVKWLMGADFPNQIAVNLPLLRIFVSVLPVILAAMVLVYLFTRWRSFWVSGAVFLFLLFAPGTLQNNQGFWHPDGLNLLFVSLVLYFLQRDRDRFGRNFFLAAGFTGLSIATRMYGFFFVLAIAVYLLSGLIRKEISWKTAFIRGVLFVLVMTLTVALCSPFLFRADARAKMSAILQEKSTEMAEGYEGDYDPRNDYRPGWDAWYPAFEDHYVEMFCFFFLIFSLLFGSFYGAAQLAHRVTFCWFVMITGYLVFFVAVKSTQYVLPALLPLMAALFSLPLTLESGQVPAALKGRAPRVAGWALAIGIFLAQFVINLIKIAPRFQ